MSKSNGLSKNYLYNSRRDKKITVVMILVKDSDFTGFAPTFDFLVVAEIWS